MASEASALEKQIARLEAVATRLENVALGAGKKKGGADAGPELSEECEAWMEFRNGKMEDFLKAIEAIPKFPTKGKKVDEIIPLAQPLREAIDCVTDILLKGDSCKKPTQEELVAAMQPIVAANTVYNDYKTSREKCLRKWDRHCGALQGVVEGLMWPIMAIPKSQAQVGFESFEFNANRILKDLKNSGDAEANKPHQDMIVKGKEALKEQVQVVKANFSTGPNWRGQKNLSEAESAVPAAKPAAEETKPVAEEKAPEPEKPKKVAPKKPMGNLADELAKGLAITSKLRKVKKGEKNKYSGEKISGKVTTTIKKAKAKKKLPDPKKSKRGKTWFLEYYQEGLIRINNEFLRGLDPSMGIFIASCLNCQFLIEEGVKVKSIVVDGCKRVQVESGDVISTIEVVNSKNCTMWLRGVTPSITLDKCDSPKVVIMDGCWNADKMVDILTSNVTAGNVELPPNGDEDGKVIPIVEQFYMNLDKDTQTAKFKPMEHAG